MKGKERKGTLFKGLVVLALELRGGIPYGTDGDARRKF